MMSEQFQIPSPRVIMEDWSLEDVLDAHLLLDEVERMRAQDA